MRARRPFRAILARLGLLPALACAHSPATMRLMSETQTYFGTCHCGAVQYEAKVDLSKPVISCNCSMCGRAGTLLSFIPISDFTLKSGDEMLVDYQFNKQHIHHLFCKQCGIKPFARGAGPDGKPMAAVNARCLEGVDVSQLKIVPYDGKSK